MAYFGKPVGIALLTLVQVPCACNPDPAPPEPRQEPPSPEARKTQPVPPQARAAQKAQPVNVITIPAREAPPRHLLVLLHGVGDSAEGFEGVGRQLARGLPQVEIVIPDGFHPFDGGGDGRQWFSRVGITEENRPERVQSAAREVSAWMDGELSRRGLSPDRLIVGGFSQGAMVSGWLALHREPSPKAVVLLSGRLSESASWPTPRVATPVFLAHGTADAVIPFSFMAEAKQGLEARGARVEGRVYGGMAHQISLQELSDIQAFLQSQLVQ